MRILDRYLRQTIYATLFFVVLVLLGIWSFLDFIQELANINVGNYSVATAIIYVGMSLPGQIYQFFPIAALMGCLLGLGRLAHSSQLTVMRAAGVSIARLTWSVVKAALWVALIMFVIGQWFAPLLKNKAEQIKAHALGAKYNHHGGHHIWLRRGNHFIDIAKVDSGNHITGVQIYSFTNKKLSAITRADSGSYHYGRWWLKEAYSTLFKSGQLLAKYQPLVPLMVTLSPHYLSVLNQDAGQQSGFALWKNIQYRELNGLDAKQYQLTFWQRLAQPITTLVLICLSIPFMFGSLRMTSMGTRLLIGISVGFIIYMLNRIFGPLTVVYNFPPVLAALMPTVCFLLAYLFLLKRIR
ncbi:MAG: LPS export ABC transporter permease LptG [Gammaproteobacteria bacterium]|nr:LPS export ABC transporter permease LptG [Gammaproteobacteria bacterium]